jgi:excisionase family DNA binding protein
MSYTSEPGQIIGQIALSIEEACKLSNLGRTKLYELIKSGALTARKCGRRTIIIRSELEAVLKALPKISGRVA